MVNLLFIAGQLLLLAFLVCFICFCIRQIIRAYYNYKALQYEQKHPGSLPRSGGGIVFNKKTRKLEGSPGKPILPFD